MKKVRAAATLFDFPTFATSASYAFLVALRTVSKASRSSALAVRLFTSSRSTPELAIGVKIRDLVPRDAAGVEALLFAALGLLFCLTAALLLAALSRVVTSPRKEETGCFQSGPEVVH